MNGVARTVLLVVLILLLIGLLPTWGYSQGLGLGWYAPGGLGLVIVILLILILLGKL